MPKVIGIDPGTNCGWAVADNGRIVESGIWRLAPRRHESSGMRYIKFRASLTGLVQAIGGNPLVAYEEVRRHAGTDAAHVYGGIVAHLQAVAHDHACEHVGIPVGTVKKFATGKGNANKDSMIAAAQSAGFRPEDDNEADAIFIALCACAQFGAPENFPPNPPDSGMV